jgi:hypothetical protein
VNFKVESLHNWLGAVEEISADLDQTLERLQPGR